MTHLFVTNDFPPKLGGIQTMLWELWRRLDPSTFAVLTTPYEGDRAWDAVQPYRVVRTREKVLLPTPSLVRRIDALADEVGASHVVLDPALPVGLVGPKLRLPYGVVLHGAEVTVPGRLPGPNLVLRHVLRGAGLVVAAGGYPLAEGERAAGRALPSVLVPPGVDTERFRPLDDDGASCRAAALRAAGRRAARREPEPARAAQGDGRPHQGGRRAEGVATPTSSSPSAVGAATDRGSIGSSGPPAPPSGWSGA